MQGLIFAFVLAGALTIESPVGLVLIGLALVLAIIKKAAPGGRNTENGKE